MKRQLSLAGLGLALILALAGCGGPPDAGGEGGSSASAPAPSEPGAGSAPNEADRNFASMMIPHHEQAVAMSETMLAKDGIHPDVTDLAVRIRQAQGPEIETMSGWLGDWDAAGEADGGHDAGHDPEHDPKHDSGHGDPSEGESRSASGGSGTGMMSGDQMEDLAAAGGDEASRLFLDSMIEHHEGAVEMAEQELDAGSHPGAKELAASIVQAQESEIKEMEALLADL